MIAAVALSLALAATAAAPAKPRYVVASSPAASAALLAGDAAAWKKATRIRWGPGPYETEFAALWTRDALYLRFDARHPRRGTP